MEASLITSSGYAFPLFIDFHGNGQYGKNVLGGNGITIETEKGDGRVSSSASCSSSTMKLDFLSQTSENITVEMAGITDGCHGHASVSETWWISLTHGARHVQFQAWGSPIVETKVGGRYTSSSILPKREGSLTPVV